MASQQNDKRLKEKWLLGPSLCDYLTVLSQYLKESFNYFSRGLDEKD